MINVSEDEFENRVFPKILANERLCRIYLQELKKTGVTFSEEINKLSHEDCINIAIRTYAHIKVNEWRQRKEIA